MPGFKSPNQRKFLFAQDKSQQQGISPIKSSPNSLSTARPPQMTQPFQAFGLGMPSAPQYHPPVSPTIKPTAIPSLPALPKIQKFARIRKMFKPSKI